jgi:hypothetical protein
MKKLLKSIILGLFILSLIGFLAITYIANKNVEDNGEVDAMKLTYFHETYEENREQFMRLATSLQKQFSDVEIAKHFVKSDVDSDLTINSVYIPAQNEKKRLLIMSSGVHGIEGFVGSAVQSYFMSEILNDNIFQNMGLLLIHAINPYGFKYERRFSENNVDMNRNFDVNKDLFQIEDEGYGKLYQFLNPEKKTGVSYLGNGFFFLKTVYHILRYKKSALRQSTVQGQYEFPMGIFYGGNDFEPQKEWLERLILEKTRDYASIFVIDIHTGLGERGKIHLLPGLVQDQRIINSIKKIFKGFIIDWQDPKKDFYPYSGGFRDYIEKLISAEKEFIKIGFEFGTLNSHKMVGSVRSLHNMILENQGFHHGYKNNKAEKIVKKRFREMFFPSSEIWRSNVIKQASEILPVLIDRYAEIDE